MRRFFKQLIYGLFYLLILALVAGGVYYFYFIPEQSCFDNIQNQDETGVDCGGQCLDCELRNLTLRIDEPLKFEAGEFKSTILAKISNPSSNYGLNDFEYEFQIFSSFGTILTTFHGRSYILPSESKYLIAPAVDVDSRDIGKTVLNVPLQNWRPKADLPVYSLRFKNIETVPLSKTVQVAGNLVNDSSSIFSSIILTGIIFGSNGEVLNASSTKVDGISAFSEAPFTIFFPNLKNVAEVNRNTTEVFYEVKR